MARERYLIVTTLEEQGEVERRELRKTTPADRFAAVEALRRGYFDLHGRADQRMARVLVAVDSHRVTRRPVVELDQRSLLWANRLEDAGARGTRERLDEHRQLPLVHHQVLGAIRGAAWPSGPDWGTASEWFPDPIGDPGDQGTLINWDSNSIPKGTLPWKNNSTKDPICND